MTAYRPLKDQSVKELVKLFDKRCLAARQLGVSGPSFDDDSDEKLPKSFTKKPATAKAIEALERKIKAAPHNFTDGLPEEYVDFLRTTNGFYGYGEGDGQDEIFRPVSKVDLAETDWAMEMLSIEFTNCEVKVDLPSTTWGLQLGAGGDEGEQWLLPPGTTKTIIQALQQAHSKAAKKDDKGKIEEVAGKLAGGFDKLSEVEHLIIQLYHWSDEVGLFSGFKHLLENFVTNMDKENDKDQDDDDDEEEGPDNSNNPRKQIPEGKPNVLKDLKFLFTGTLDLLDRNSAKTTVEKYGGKVITNLEKTDYIVLGEQCGPKKLATIKEKNLRTISEEGFFQLLEGGKPKIGMQEDLAGASTKYIPPKPAKKDQGKTKKAEPAAKPVATAKSSSATKSGNAGNSRKAALEGKPNALEGMKLIFTGTMNTMDRNAAKKTAEKHGATVTTKLANTDLIVLGTAAGPKKLQEIEEKGLKTCTEDEFLAILGGGAEDEGEEDEEEEVPNGKKRGAPAAAAEEEGAKGKGKGRGKKAKKTA